MCSCQFCSIGCFNKCVGELSNNISTPDIVDEDLDGIDEADDPEMLVFIMGNSYVALFSSPKSLELFFLLKVEPKSAADQDMIDIYGHLIQKGSEYICGYYLEKIAEKKQKVFYKQLKKRDCVCLPY